MAGSAGDMLDLIAEGAFVATGGGRLQPVSKVAVFSEFMAPLDLDEEIVARAAEAALAFLVEQEMVEVAGDTISVPARFWSDGRVSPPDPNYADKPHRSVSPVRPVAPGGSVKTTVRIGHELHCVLAWT